MAMDPRVKLWEIDLFGFPITSHVTWYWVLLAHGPKLPIRLTILQRGFSNLIKEVTTIAYIYFYLFMYVGDNMK